MDGERGRSERRTALKLIPPPDRFGLIESRAEQRIAGLLQEVDLGEPATCLYSVHLPRHEYKRMAEIDFLVVARGLLLVIEVKGGRVARREGTWLFTDRYGHVHDKREGPFQQARSAMFALDRLLRERIPALQIETGPVVITPDQALAPDLEWDPVEHIGPTGCSVIGLEQALRRAARHWRARARYPHPTEHGELLKVLRPDFDRVPGLTTLAGRLEHDYVRLAADQYAALSGGEANRRLFITGGAGSGKTLLAAETARRAASGGARVLLTCRSPRIIDLLRSALADTTVTCRTWQDAAYQARQTHPASTGPPGPAADVLIVDEAQDLMNVEDSLLLDALVDGGLQNGRWRLFSDPNNQARIGGHFDPDVHDELADHAARYHLPYNCRNTAAVVGQTQLITGADVGVARVGEGPAVDYDHVGDDESTAALLDQRLKRLREDEVAPGDVVVLTLRNRPTDSAARQSRAYRKGILQDLAPLVDATTSRSPTEISAAHTPRSQSPIRLSTVADFKGLEAAHVLVIDIDALDDQRQLALLYVAMTRPRVSLWLAVGDRAWEQMRTGTIGRIGSDIQVTTGDTESSEPIGEPHAQRR